MRPLIIIIYTIFLGCENGPNEHLQNIEGYWEIESVYKHDKLIKNYKISPAIDYFSINKDFKGFRKKLKPDFNGTLETSKDVLNFEIEIQNNALFLNYVVDGVMLTEEVLLANKQKLILKNTTGLFFYYKAYKPLDLSR